MKASHRVRHVTGKTGHGSTEGSLTEIREALMSDAERIATLITELGYPTTTVAMNGRLESILSDPDYITLVAVEGNTVLGVVGAALGRYYEKDGTYARLVVLAVSAPARGRGVGSRLVEAIEHWSASKGAREVVVNSGLQRLEAHGFYERCGYRRTGLRFVKRLDAIS